MFYTLLDYSILLKGFSNKKIIIINTMKMLLEGETYKYLEIEHRKTNEHKIVKARLRNESAEE